MLVPVSLKARILKTNASTNESGSSSRSRHPQFNFNFERNFQKASTAKIFSFTFFSFFAPKQDDVNLIHVLPKKIGNVEAPQNVEQFFDDFFDITPNFSRFVKAHIHMILKFCRIQILDLCCQMQSEADRSLSLIEFYASLTS